MLELKEAYEKKLMGFFRGLLLLIIADHNFNETEQRKMTPKELYTLIFESPELTQKVISASFFIRAQKSADISPPFASKSLQEDTVPSSTGSTDAG